MLALLIGACTESTPVGRKCFIGDQGAAASTVTITGNALECESRMCMSVPRSSATLPDGSEYAALCTATCESDSDCVGSPSDQTPCQTGFSCQIPTVTGALRCLSLCVCNDYLSEADKNKPTPAACEP